MPRYCGDCGQETALKPPTVGEFLQQFGGSYLATEGALWRTLRLLLLHPGALTRQYLDGRRRHHVLPLRLYLTISLLALLVLRWHGAPEPTGHPAAAKADWFQLDEGDRLEFTLIELGGLRVGQQGGVFVCEGLPPRWCAQLRERFSLDPQSLQREMRHLPERFIGHWGSAMFALLPLFALLQKLVYLNRRLRWSEHLVFALHVHAFWFALLLLCTLAGQPWLNRSALVAAPLYTLLAARHVYGGRWLVTLLRAAIVAAAYGLAMAVAMVVVGVWAFIA